MPAHTLGQSQRRIRRPAYFWSSRPRPAINSHSRSPSTTTPTGGATTDRTAASSAAPSVNTGSKPCLLVLEPRSGPRQQRARREHADQRADRAADQPGPDGIAATAQRTGEQQRTDHDRGGRQDERERSALELFRAQSALDERERNRADGHREQERRLLQPRHIAVREVDLNVASPQRADGERRKERTDANSGGHADPLEYVEDQIHRAVP